MYDFHYTFNNIQNEVIVLRCLIKYHSQVIALNKINLNKIAVQQNEGSFTMDAAVILLGFSLKSGAFRSGDGKIATNVIFIVFKYLNWTKFDFGKLGILGPQNIPLDQIF